MAASCLQMPPRNGAAPERISSGKPASLKKRYSISSRPILEQDRKQTDQDIVAMETQYVETLQKRVSKIKGWLAGNDDKPGKTGKAKKSNITDNESAKMKTPHGVMQGYDGMTTVDGKHQIIVHAEAFGEAQEHDLLIPAANKLKQDR
jgi:hypothetical protein